LGRLRFSRSGGLVVLAGALVAALAGGWLDGAAGNSSGSATTPPYQHFRTRPDLRSPVLTISHPSGRTAPGYIFLAPKGKVAQVGAMIVDDSGQVVWFDPLPVARVADFKVQVYQGRPVLTWWQKQVGTSHGEEGGHMIMDASYHLLKVVRAGNGLTADNHDFQLTARGTALMTIIHEVPMDLSAVGGPKQGYALEGVVQEVSLATGRVLFEWHSAGHVAPAESYQPLGPSTGLQSSPYDYFHVNSIAVDTDGNLLVSARHTHAVYKIRRSDGAIIWRLGGKKSDFTFGPGAQFAWQHDARRQADGTITLFDNNAERAQQGSQSRALVLHVDEAKHRVRLVRAYAHQPPLLSTSQGNEQRLPDGHVFVGWGSKPDFTEYSVNGQVLLDGSFGGAGSSSYRAFRFVWHGRPTTKPAIALSHAGDGSLTLFASWNGATEVARWQVVAGHDARHLGVVATAARTGFETALPVKASGLYAAVRALDARGKLLGSSVAVRSSG
jgi:Arylsulfotransferase (ASST)